MERRQRARILEDLKKKLVFIVGPRQVGKTWLAKDLMTEFANPVYLNCDAAEDRRMVARKSWRLGTDLLVLDELHKIKGWKSYLKGLFDTRPPHLSILVTGSARLDTVRRGGDSLAGRYFVHHLLPFSPAELRSRPEGADLDRYLVRGGFPEPFLAPSDTEAQRWRQHYVDGLLRHDVFDLGRVGDLRAVELVLDLLRQRVGSPASYSSLAEDVGVSPNTVKKYINLLEALYVVFRVPPFARNLARALSKMPKIYFYDTGLVRGDEGARFENLMAVCLEKDLRARADAEGLRYELNYLRTKDGREVDFCLVREREPYRLLEAKVAEEQPSASLKKFSLLLDLPAAQILYELRQERREGRVELRRAMDFLRELLL